MTALSVGLLSPSLSPRAGGETVPFFKPRGENESDENTLTILTPVPKERGQAVALEGVPSDNAVPSVLTGVGLARI